MKCWQLVACVGLWLTLLARDAQADDARECTGERPWVALGGGVRPALARAVASELRAGLAPSHIDVCTEDSLPPSEPLARVTLAQVGEAEPARFSLDVTDSVTQKRVGRDLSLEKLPADGRALALAVAAEELLRASWAELALRGVHRPATAPPPEVRAVVERAPPAPRRFTAIGARLAFEHFTGGQTHYGGDAFLALPLGPRFGIVAALGARRGLSEQAPHGSIGARALSGELGLSLSLLEPSALELGAFVSARALWLRYEASATAGADAGSQSGLAVVTRAGLVLAFGRRGVVRSYSTCGVGLPLRAFSASDSGTTVTGASGLELFAAAGLALEVP